MYTANINDNTGIAYGIISANKLWYDLVDDMMLNDSIKDHYSDYLVCHDEEKEYCTDDECLCEIDEGFFKGEIDGVKYEGCWLGGALNIVILESPHITHNAGRASPCVPNMGILDSMGDVTSYTVPENWLDMDY
jgi:hypothetical protein